MEPTNPILIAAEYKKVISAFKKRYDVQNGDALGYRKNQSPTGELTFDNKPKGIGDGLATTGWCVSASQALLLDPIFQILIKNRGAKAKLVSIDIKEQYYGICYSGSQNKWHTAILVQDNNQNLIVDITCAQFGNKFVGKDIWDFETWEKSLRNSLDKHVIIDFDDTELSYLPKQTTPSNIQFTKVFVENALHDITTITDEERKVIADFFLKHIDTLNSKLLVGNVNKFDYKYLDNINNLFKSLDFYQGTKQFSVMEFPNKISAQNWIKNLFNNSNVLQQFIVTSNTIENSCKYNNIDYEDFNKETTKDRVYIVLEFDMIRGYGADFIKYAECCVPYGIRLNFENSDIYNGGKLLNQTIGGIEKKTNTIFIKCSN